jgi:O-antigen ligase
VGAFLLVLPESEALTHIFFGVSLAFLILAQPRLPRLDIVDLSLLGFALVPLVAHFTSTIATEVRVSKASSWLEMAMLTLMLRRAGFSAIESRWCVRLIVLGVLLAVLAGQLLHHASRWPSLHSVGFVNQVALYLDVALIASLLGVRIESGAWRIAMSISSVALVPLIWMTDSATAAIVMLLVVMIALWMLPVFRGSNRWRLVRPAMFLAIVLAAVLNPKVRYRMQQTQPGTDLFSARDQILRSALAVFPDNPWFGTGARSFGLATSEERVRNAVESRGGAFEPDRYLFSSNESSRGKGVDHGHGLFTNTLVERGLVGLGCMTTLLLAWSLRLARSGSDAVFVWVSGMCYVLVGGAGNTTLMVEHGWLLLSLWALIERHGRAEEMASARDADQEPTSAESTTASTAIAS